MFGWVRRRIAAVHERLLRREIGDAPAHVAVIQDGNRRFARERGDHPAAGHRAGAETTERLLEWCEEVGIEELTLYALSTENFGRPAEELDPLFDLIESKLREFADADRVHENGVRIRAIGDLDRLPSRIRDAVAYAEERTAGHDGFRLNVALAYGGRAALLTAARAVVRDVRAGDLEPSEIDAAEVESRLARGPARDVDLIVRTGGDERTSNFLPWHANGNEAAVYFCAPYWPEFSKLDFLRGIRTYESREASWRRTRAERAATLIGAVAETSVEEARTVAGRLRGTLAPDDGEAGAVDVPAADVLDAD